MTQLAERSTAPAPVKTIQLTDAQIHTALNSINSAADYNGIITNAQLDLQRVLRTALRTP